MAGRTMNIRRTAALVLLALGLAACHGAATGGPPPLAGARIGGPFALVDQDGRMVRETSWPGRYRIMYFGYTFCPDVCPTDVQALTEGLKLFAQREQAAAARVQPIFVTVDPARDTPAVLRQFVRAFSPSLEGLTGSPAEIARVAREYGSFYRARDAAAGSSDTYLVDHSRQAILFGPDGAPIVLLPADEGGQAVADELARWVR